MKLNSNGITFKNTKTNKSEQLSSTDIDKLSWQRRSKGYCLKIQLKSGNIYRYDGFQEDDFKKLDDYFNRNYKLHVTKTDFSVKGWNWGKTNFQGDALDFDIDGKLGFEIPLKNVSNTNAQKNEAVLQFHQNEDSSISLMEIRFHIPTNENEDADTAQDFCRKVLSVADIASTDVDAICTLSELNCLTLRGRYDVKFYSDFIDLHGKTFDYKIQYAHILRLFLLPHKHNKQMYFVIALDPPIKQGQTRYPYLIVLFNNDDTVSVNLAISDNSSITSLAKKKDYKKTKTAVGAFSFKKLVEKSTVFVDKSLVIKEFLEDSAEVSLITCPRRWGKSINMNMIKTFCEIEVDEFGVKYTDKKQTTNYKLFKGILKSNELEKPLNIASCEDLMNDYQGEYPVIYIDFKNISAISYEEVVAGLKICLNEAFRQHKYLLKSARLEEDDIETLKIYIDRRLHRDLNIHDLMRGLKLLSEVLHSHFGKKAYILVDEYDAPINRILQRKNIPEDDLEKTLDLFRTIMGSTFKGNDYLEKGLITGVFRIAKSSLFSDLNNIVEYNIMNNKYAKYYGFTQDEVRLLLNEYKIPEKDQHTAQKWYNGYRILRDPTLEIYNPWSIINYLDREGLSTQLVFEFF